MDYYLKQIFVCVLNSRIKIHVLSLLNKYMLDSIRKYLLHIQIRNKSFEYLSCKIKLAVLYIYIEAMVNKYYMPSKLDYVYTSLNVRRFSVFLPNFVY